MKSYVCVLSTNNYLEGVLILKKNLEQVKCKPKYKQQLKELIELCRKAIKEDKYVIHFGI